MPLSAYPTSCSLSSDLNSVSPILRRFPTSQPGAASQASVPNLLQPSTTSGRLPIRFAPTSIMRAHRFKANGIVGVDMRPINVSLSANTWELAKRKKNFSQWIRLQLHAERRVARELLQIEEDLTQARSAIKQYIKLVDELNKELDKK